MILTVFRNWEIFIFLIFDPKDTILLSSVMYYMHYIVFFEKVDFSQKSSKKTKFSFLTFFSKMTFLNFFNRILVKKNHFGRFGQVSGGGDTSDPRVTILISLFCCPMNGSRGNEDHKTNS